MHRRFLFFLSLLAYCHDEPTTNPPTPEKARVISNELRVRLTPHVLGAELGRLKKDEEVKVLQISRLKIRLGQDEAHWYKIESKSGLKGWVYGAYLDLEGKPSLAKDQSDKISKMLVGRWYIQKEHGALSDRFLSLYLNRQFDCGMGQKLLGRGYYSWENLDTGKVEIKLFPEEKSSLPLSELIAEPRGEILTLKGKWQGQQVYFTLAEKNPEKLEESEEPKP
ncbi:MAG: SH3 domain-containing protein [Leptospiraceae bacterium]|nr:SH3 domain-containing protein [Leptospiraceae bacterium]MDW8305621.1 SH3 domain-containing protein [Leptospiraceae bacterium]